MVQKDIFKLFRSLPIDPFDQLVHLARYSHFKVYARYQPSVLNHFIKVYRCTKSLYRSVSSGYPSIYLSAYLPSTSVNALSIRL